MKVEFCFEQIDADRLSKKQRNVKERVVGVAVGAPS